MEQIVAIAAARIARTNPDGISRLYARIRPPRHVRIARQAQFQRQLDIPAHVRVRRRRVRRAFRRQKILVIRCVKMRRQSPLLEIVPAGNRLRRRLGAIQGRQKHRCQNRDDRDHNQQLDQRKSSTRLHRNPQPEVENELPHRAFLWQPFSACKILAAGFSS
jgi:hypothetical protein